MKWVDKNILDILSLAFTVYSLTVFLGTSLISGLRGLRHLWVKSIQINRRDDTPPRVTANKVADEVRPFKLGDKLIYLIRIDGKSPHPT